MPKIGDFATRQQVLLFLSLEFTWNPAITVIGIDTSILAILSEGCRYASEAEVHFAREDFASIYSFVDRRFAEKRHVERHCGGEVAFRHQRREVILFLFSAYYVDPDLQS